MGAKINFKGLKLIFDCLKEVHDQASILDC